MDHLPGLPARAVIGYRVLPFTNTVMALFSPLFTFEVHEAVSVPDCDEAQPYESRVTVSLMVGLMVTVVVALLDLVGSDLRLMVSSKT